MSLRVWLPLNGNIENHGSANVTVTNSGAIVQDQGKTGKCYKFSTSPSYLLLPKEAMTSFENQCSVCFWLKILSWKTGWDTFFQAGLGDAPWSNYIFGFLRNNSSKCAFSISNGESSYISGSCSSTINFQLNTWYHIGLVYKIGHCLLYINGQLDRDCSTAVVPNFSKITTITIGIGNNKTSYQTNCLMNDFRIYDHALSQQEIKKISQGLVLHYPLDNRGLGNQNLLTKNICEFSNWTNINPTCVEVTSNNYKNTFHVISSVSGKWENVYSPVISVTANQQYTLSCQYEVKDNYNYSSSYGNFGLTIMKAAPTNTNPLNNTIARIPFENVITAKKKGFITFTPTTSSIYLNICGGSITDGQSNKNFEINNIKLEEGSIATPWLPAPSDDLYTILQLNDNKEADISGNLYNGIKNNIIYSTDSPLYKCSSVLNGSNSYIKIDNNNWMSNYSEQLTVSIWAYSEDWSKITNGGRIWSCTESGGFNIQGGASGYWRFPVYCASNTEHTSHAYYYRNTGLKISDLDSSGWHMITWVYTTTEHKVYLDGELYSTYSIQTYGIKFNTNAKLFLGCEANTANPSGPYLNGQLSDFRIYATALSADDIKELYEYRS